METTHYFVTTLLGWYRAYGRDLPWRGTRDPYAIWLSEIILQQTQVRQGWGYWERFMKRWPTVEALAAATEDEVLREWQGLGYYSRARHLHAAACQVVAWGGFPTTIEGLLRLKGVGDYTAAAIGSIAFGLPSAVVDGNVYRVLSRHFGISTPVNSSAGKKEFALLAQSLVDGETGVDGGTSVVGVYNQAVMDFGAMVCTPVSPHCVTCPLQESCVALREDRVRMLPVKRRTVKVGERRMVYIYIRWMGQTALHRRAEGDIWAGLYEPLAVEGVGDDILRCGGACRLLCKDVKHVLTHRVIYADFWLWEPSVEPVLPEGYFWIVEQDIGRYGVPRLVELLYEELWKE